MYTYHPSPFDERISITDPNGRHICIVENQEAADRLLALLNYPLQTGELGDIHSKFRGLGKPRRIADLILKATA